MVLVVLDLNLLYELRNTEEIIHLLERHTLGFWDKEPHEEEHAVAEARVDKEGTIKVKLACESDARRGGEMANLPIAVSSNSDQHVGCSAGYYEVEKPLCCSGDSDVERP
jgi:hypothetical protein